MGKAMKAMKAKQVSRLRKSVAAKVLDEKAIVLAREKELKGMAAADIKELAMSKGLEKGTKTDMIVAILGLEAKAREQIKIREAKVREVVKKISDDIAAKSNDELKEMLGKSNLKLGGSKTDRVDRLVAHAKDAGEVDKILFQMDADERREELTKADKSTLVNMCQQKSIDPFVKEVMIERLVMDEFSKRAYIAAMSSTTMLWLAKSYCAASLF